MSDPFIYVGTFRLKEGKLEAFKEQCERLAKFVEVNEPRMIAFNLYANEEGSEASVVQVHPDADSMVFHMRLLRDHVAGAGDEESAIGGQISNQIYGIPNETVLEMIEQFDPGVPLIIKPRPLGGFTRPATERTVGAG